MHSRARWSTGTHCTEICRLPASGDEGDAGTDSDEVKGQQISSSALLSQAEIALQFIEHRTCMGAERRPDSPTPPALMPERDPGQP